MIKFFQAHLSLRQTHELFLMKSFSHMLRTSGLVHTMLKSGGAISLSGPNYVERRRLWAEKYILKLSAGWMHAKVAQKWHFDTSI